MVIDKYLIKPNTTIKEALKIIDETNGSVLFVVNDNKELLGTVSDGDVRRWILQEGGMLSFVETVMNKNPKYVETWSFSEADKILNKYNIRAVPVLQNNKLVDIIFREKRQALIKNSLISKGIDAPVVIMAGGKGTRLYPYTKILPKPLIPIGEIPIVERVMDGFYDFGITKIYMTVNYKKNMIQSYFSETDKSYDIEYVEETKPLGTAGSLKLIEDLVDEILFVANCDSLIRTDYEQLYEKHKKNNYDITIVAAIKNDRIPYGVLSATDDGELDYMEEKPTRSYLINTGMYVINSKVIDLIPKDVMFHMTDLINVAKDNNYRVGIYPIGEDAFLDMGEFAEMRRMEEKLNLICEDNEA